MVLLSLQINKINQKIRIDKAVYELNIIKQKVVFLSMRRMGKVLFSESKVSVLWDFKNAKHGKMLHSHN